MNLKRLIPITTIRDIATAAVVSMGTISNYFNNPNLVAEETRQKIAQKITELNYHPRAAARALKSRETHRIGIVPLISPEVNRSTDPGDNAFLELLSGMNTVAAESGYDILLSTATNTDQELKIYERLVGEGEVDGLVMTGIRSHNERVEFLSEHKFPFVVFGQAISDRNYSYVNDRKARRLIGIVLGVTTFRFSSRASVL